MGLLRTLINNPRYALMRGPARFSSIRNSVAGLKSALGRHKAKKYEHILMSRMDSTLFPDIDLNKFVENMQEAGCSFGLKLPKSIIDEVEQYAEKNPVFAFRNEEQGFSHKDRKKAESILDKEILLAQYFNVQKDCNAINMLVSDPVLNWIALKYLGCTPTFLGAVLWWTYPVTPNRDEQLKHAHYFHRDIDDFKFIKFFFYLTDVDEGDGGHWLVPGSHKKAPHIRPKDLFLTRRFEDDEIKNFYSKNNVIEVYGKKGIGFAEDTLCVHKGATPSKKPRLILHLQFGLFNFVPENDRRPDDELKRIC